jgi:metal-sulfur cluster biosynthetic enzyme
MTKSKEEIIEEIKKHLNNVYDPEIPICSVLELGLIYDIEVEGTHAKITHTLTSPMCPFAEQICMEIYMAPLMVDEIETCDVRTTFDPPFSPEMMPEETRLLLGLL